jgi:hypothetical protein
MIIRGWQNLSMEPVDAIEDRDRLAAVYQIDIPRASFGFEPFG